MADIRKPSLLKALGTMLGENVNDAAYSVEVLQGGTVSDVVKVSGSATSNSAGCPFDMVVKTQRKWDRFGDANSWRREYDIYRHGLVEQLPQTIRLPACYLLEEEADVTRIWMEYVQGKTGSEQLHADELALAAERLGALQAEFSLRGPRDLPYLRPCPAARPSFEHWWGRMRKPLQTPIDGFPEGIRNALNESAARAESLFETLDRLPVTLCQGDVHHDNLILKGAGKDTRVYLIDWDCAGYGRLGEDAVDLLLEAFVYSDRDVSLLPEFRKRIMEGYCAGVQKGGIPFVMEDALVRGLFVLAWGYRVADLYLYYRDERSKARCADILRRMLQGDA